MIAQPLIAFAQTVGMFRITGTVDEMGVPGRYLVRLFERSSGWLLRETWSATDGSYAFKFLPYLNQGYVLVAHDHGASPQNAAIADLVTPEPIP